MTCTQCVMDDSVEGITFDEAGRCNFCTDYLLKRENILRGPAELDLVIQKIGRKEKKYNCIVGISGGLDSSWLLYVAARLGLKPLAVHIDTGWNTEISVSNIRKITASLNVDLQTVVLDWEQFRQVQLAYLRSGVIDLEFPTDHYYLAALYKYAADAGVKFLLTGNNFISEGIMPPAWIHNKGDTMNMLDIFKKYGGKARINKLPTLTLLRRFYYYNIKGIQNIFLLNYLRYDRTEAAQVLKKECGWRDYPVKHGESVFTRFYQRYILPARFGIDYRKAHFSSLICNAQLSRDKALAALTGNIAEGWDPEEDKAYVLKKLGLSEEEFQSVMDKPKTRHEDFLSEIPVKKLYAAVIASLHLQAFLRISNRH